MELQALSFPGNSTDVPEVIGEGEGEGEGEWEGEGFGCAVTKSLLPENWNEKLSDFFLLGLASLVLSMISRAPRMG